MKFSAWVASVLLVLSACNGSGANPNYQPPNPTIYRNDIKFGYFGALDDMVGVYSHTSIYYDMGFGGLDYTISGIRAADMDTALGIDYILWEKVNNQYLIRADAGARLKDFLARLKSENLLGKVVAVSLIDEPDNKGIDGAMLEKALKITKAEFAAQQITPKYFQIYAAKFTWPGVSLFDWVGFDNYSAGSGIFINGDYAKLKGILRADQLIILLPGGAEPWLQEPQSFINIAHGDQQVTWIMPFTWFTSSQPDADFGKGIRDNKLRPVYCLMGQKLVSKSGGC